VGRCEFVLGWWFDYQGKTFPPTWLWALVSVRCSITVDVQYHVTSRVPDDGVGAGCCIVHEFHHGHDSCLGTVRLSAGERVEGMDHGGVNDATVVEKCTYHLLEAEALVIGEVGKSAIYGSILGCGSVAGWHVAGWSMDEVRGFVVLKLVQGHGDVARHR
jgi:hypothetical protein